VFFGHIVTSKYYLADYSIILDNKSLIRRHLILTFLSFCVIVSILP
jgi:hypothetical protein